MKKVLIIDAQGGGIGRQLITGIRNTVSNVFIMAVGTNSTATSAMMRAGADISGTGENAVCVASRDADIIVGPIGIVIADSMLGEITAEMAVSVAQSCAKLILIPFNHRGRVFVGVPEIPLGKLIADAIEEIRKTAEN